MKPIDMISDGQHSRNIEARICNPVVGGCGRSVNLGEFKDKISRDEYSISGLCQSCQNEVFMGDDSADYFDDPADYH